MRLLPDLQSLATVLDERWRDQVIQRIDGIDNFERHLANVAATELVPRLVGRKVHRVRRRGRHLLITLASGPNLYRWYVLLWTPGPTGVFLDGVGGAFTLDLGGQAWSYHDRFGWGQFWLWTHAEIVGAHAPTLAGLGPDWLDEAGSAESSVREYRPDSQRSVKAVLVDQAIAAGLDNVLAIEALHAAQLHPHTVWRWLSPAQRSRVAECARAAAALTSSDGLQIYARGHDWCLRRDCEGTISAVRDLPPLPTRSFVCCACQPPPETAV